MAAARLIGAMRSVPGEHGKLRVPEEPEQLHRVDLVIHLRAVNRCIAGLCLLPCSPSTDIFNILCRSETLQQDYGERTQSLMCNYH